MSWNDLKKKKNGHEICFFFFPPLKLLTSDISLSFLYSPLRGSVCHVTHLHFSLYLKFWWQFCVFLLQETTETIVFRMLDRLVAIELMEKTLQQVIRPYINEHKLNEDELFSKYIQVDILFVWPKRTFLFSLCFFTELYCLKNVFNIINL